MVDNLVKADGSMISKFMHNAYVFTKNSTEAIALKQCKRQGFKPDDERYWGYKCCHLDRTPHKERLFTYAVNWIENRPRPTFMKGYEPKIIARNENAILDYERIPQKETTFCNINTAIYLKEYGAVKLAKGFIGPNCRDLVLMIPGKHKELKLSIDDNFVLHKICPEEAINYSKLGLFCFAINRDHVAPIYGSNTWVTKKDKIKSSTEEECAWCLNIGAAKRDGYNSIFFSFYINKYEELDYYALLRTDV